MSIFSVLRTGAGAMQAARQGIATTSNNIANADTPGYARQRLQLQTTGTMRAEGLLVGRGVTAKSITSAYDRFTQDAATARTIGHGAAEQRAEAWAAIEPVFAEGESGRLGGAISALFDSFSRLGSDPTDASLRRQVLAAGESLSSMFNQADTALAEQATAADGRIAEAVPQANALFQEMAALNKEISAHEGAGGGEASDLRARRTAVLEQLADLVPVKATPQADGSLTVLLGGHAMVQGGHARSFTASADPTTGQQAIHLALGGTTLDVTDELGGSRIGAMVEQRDADIPGLRAQLDGLAFDIASAVNTAHAGAYGADGVTGRNFFAAPGATAGAAGAFALDPSLVGNPSAVAASGAPGVPSDNTGAQALAALGDATLAGGGTTTFIGFYADLVAEVGVSASGAYAAETRSVTQLNAALDLRDSASGVSVEEEALDLLKFQDAYQAAGRVLSTASEMMDELFRIV